MIGPVPVTALRISAPMETEWLPAEAACPRLGSSTFPAAARRRAAAASHARGVIPAERLLKVNRERRPQDFPRTIESSFLPRSPAELYAAGEQAHVPLLVGWNSEEASYAVLFMGEQTTLENYGKIVRKRFGAWASEVLRLYPARTDEEVIVAATDLASDLFLGYSTWKWADLHGRTGGQSVFRYLYAHARPPMRPEMGDAVGGLASGVLRGAEAQRLPAAHGTVYSADIE